MMKGKRVLCYECAGTGEIKHALDYGMGYEIVACKSCDKQGGWTIDFELLAAAPAQAQRIAELEAALQTYANHDNWTAGVAPSYNPRIFSHPADLFGPPWNIAEQALAGAEEEA